jgi:hypothetical protein
MFGRQLWKLAQINLRLRWRRADKNDASPQITGNGADGDSEKRDHRLKYRCVHGCFFVPPFTPVAGERRGLFRASSQRLSNA